MNKGKVMFAATILLVVALALAGCNISSLGEEKTPLSTPNNLTIVGSVYSGRNLR
jgi:hypothetical protein